MFSGPRRFILGAVAAGLGFASSADGHACVWKVTEPGGGVLYLGGSIHALRSTDYPLPAAYNRAFDASERIVFEDDPKVSPFRARRVSKSMELPRNDSLKNHLDPRTYDYLKRVFTRAGIDEKVYSQLRPWALILALWSPSASGLSSELGIEGYMERRAHANNKPISGLESFDEHMQIISGLSDRQAEAVILMTFIPQDEGSDASKRGLDAWRRGDADGVERQERTAFADFPAFQERLVAARNRNWIPKIERDLKSGHVYFVIAGAAHMGGPNGVLALLRARGYQIEQL
ncbi:MAG: TraB/GumN family protein [Chthoniobacterales bacterium]